VTGRDDINIMTSFPLKVEHHIRQIVNAFWRPFAALANLPVNAEHASQAAICEKYRAWASTAYERRFFTKMRIAWRNLELWGCLSKSLLPRKPIGAALSRAQFTAFHHIPESFSSFFQFSASVQFQIGRLKIRLDLSCLSHHEPIFLYIVGRTGCDSCFSLFSACREQ